MGWHIISDPSDSDFFCPFLFLADVIDLSKYISNIMLVEVLPHRGPLSGLKCNPKSQKYAIFNMVKNTNPELNLESDMMVHLFLMGLSDSGLLGLPKW